MSLLINILRVNNESSQKIRKEDCSLWSVWPCLFGLKMMKMGQGCVKSGLQSAMVRADQGRGQWAWRLPRSLPSLLPSFLDLQVGLSGSLKAVLTWQLVTPARGGVPQPDSSLSSLHDLPSARNREH